MHGEVHFLDHCSLAETSGTFLKQATYFYLQLTPQQSVSKLSLLSFVFICKMPCDFWPGALTTRWADSDYSLPFPASANYCWLQQVLGWWTLGILHSFYFSLLSFHHFHLIVIFFLSFWNISQLQLTKCPSASAVVVALGDVNRFTWTWLPVNNPGRANQVTKEGQIAKSDKYVLIANRKVNVCLVQIGCQWWAKQ